MATRWTCIPLALGFCGCTLTMVAPADQPRAFATEPSAAVEAEAGAGPHVMLVADHEPVEEVILSFDGAAWDLADYHFDLAHAISRHAGLRILGDPLDVQPWVELLIENGVPEDRVVGVEALVDSTWVRDYGPIYVRVDDGIGALDLPYHAERPHDDDAPLAVAATQGLPLWPLALPIEGGHILADGSGLCVLSHDVIHLSENQNIEEPVLRQTLNDALGCLDSVFLQPLFGEETGHVDLFVLIAGPRRALLGSYRDAQDPVNAERLDENARRLAAAGFEVTRVPMPSNSHRWTFRSYLNALLLDGAILVPVYTASRRHERAALRLIAEAFPEREVVAIASEAIIEEGGAVHCTTRALPRR